MPQNVISVTNVTKKFDETVAVGDISFDVPRSQIFGLLGANGAGKTTTISMLLGLLLPTSGEILIFGEDIVTRRPHLLPRMNFSSPYVDLPKRLSVKENLKVYGRLYGIRNLNTRIAELAADLAISDFMDKPFGQLSSGQRTRVALAKSLLNQPELLLLDEPTASLDPDTADWIRAYLEQYCTAFGATILLASHNMAEVERMCGQVVIMKSGQVVARGTPGELNARFGRTTMEEVFLDIARNRAADRNAAIPAG